MKVLTSIAHQQLVTIRNGSPKSFARVCSAPKSSLPPAGLGPTIDDPTRDAIALAMGVETEFRSELWDQIQERFKRYGRTPTDNNKRQAYVPKGAVAVENSVGTAPAFICETKQPCRDRTSWRTSRNGTLNASKVLTLFAKTIRTYWCDQITRIAHIRSGRIANR